MWLTLTRCRNCWRCVINMTLQVTGKNVETGQSFKSYVEERFSSAMEKYSSAATRGHVRLAKQRHGFHTDLTVKLATGLLVAARGEGRDAYASADAAIAHLAKQVRRHKGRIKSWHKGVLWDPAAG